MGRLLVILAVAGIAFWLVGSRLVDRGGDVNAVARSSADNINSVAGILREATKNVQGQGRPEQTRWQETVNGICVDQSAALDRLGRPASLDEIAAYATRALAIVRRHHDRLALTNPPEAVAPAAARAGRALTRQERLLARVRAAARRGDTSAAFTAINDLRTLARAANPNLVGLGLTDCRLASWGFPL